MDRFGIYRTMRWRRLRKEKLAVNPVCQYCNQKLATEVDHRVSIFKGGDPWAWDNLLSACHSCHSQKTRTLDQGRRFDPKVKGVDPATGLPIDRNHWWRKE